MVEPVVNQWYKLQDGDCYFEVLALNDDFLIVQQDNGIVEEYSRHQWEQMPLDLAQPSELDWSISWDNDPTEQDDPFSPRNEHQYYSSESELSQDFLDDDLEDCSDHL